MASIPDAPLLTESTDLSTYPTTSLQQIGFFIIFFFPALALVVVSLRVYSRCSARTFGWDDGFIVAAMVRFPFARSGGSCLISLNCKCSHCVSPQMTALAEAGCSYVMMKTNFIGVHTWQIPPLAQPTERPRSQVWAYVVIMLYNPQLCFVKSSVLFFLLRIGGHKPGIRWSIHALNVCNILLMVSVFVASVFTCVPVNKYWDRGVPGHCNDEGLQYIVSSSVTALTDILVVILPIKIVVGLQMPMRLKMGLTFVLTLGIVVAIVSILRLIWLIDYHYGDLFQNPDFSYDIRFVYSTIECNLAIICASIPALSSLLKRWFPNRFAKLTKSGGGDGRKYPNTFFFRHRDDDKTAHDQQQTSSHVIRTFGGSTIVVKDLPASPLSSSYLCSPLDANPRQSGDDGSDEEGILFDIYNIRKTTKFDVSYNDAGSVRSGDLARSASRFRYQQSMGVLSGEELG
ncbi:uncharacterized protein PG986_004100 [Apiospora aurea]|uniref:Rhodopsin domain-containing protein n=1 Tax=Apiospora aurea TaxID=335848 RepID=A0ABR1QLZ3_9PEZI